MANAYVNKERPVKPYPEFPLFTHDNGQCYRKICGKLDGLGEQANPIAAFDKHNAEYAYLKESITLPLAYDGWCVGDLGSEF